MRERDPDRAQPGCGVTLIQCHAPTPGGYLQGTIPCRSGQPDYFSHSPVNYNAHVGFRQHHVCIVSCLCTWNHPGRRRMCQRSLLHSDLLCWGFFFPLSRARFSSVLPLFLCMSIHLSLNVNIVFTSCTIHSFLILHICEQDHCSY